MRGAAAWIGQRFDALGQVFQNRDLRRLELAWCGFYVGEWAHVIALAVYAYDQGGAAAVGLVGLIRMLPAAAAVPFAGLLADRYRRERLLLGVHSIRAAAIGAAAAALFSDAPPALVYVLAVVATVATAAFRPCHLALVPALSRTPRELVAANVSSATLESLATLAGPAVAGILLATTSEGVVFAASAGVFLAAALLMTGISIGDVVRGPRSRKAPVEELLAGVRTLAVERDARLFIGLFAAQTLVRGFLNVLIVVAALELMDIGDSGVGFLNAALGAGGVLGGLGAVVLVERRRLARFFQAGLALWGVPIALIGVWPEAAFSLVCLAAVGLGNSLLDVSGFTLIQRGVQDSVLGRVFGVFEMLCIAAVGIGSIAAAPLIDGLGTRGAFVAVGGFLLVLAVVFARRFGAIDAAAMPPKAELELLRSLPVFAPLPLVTLEQLASKLVPVSVPAGEEIMRQGDPGDRFYMIARGEVEVAQDGAKLTALGPGEGFGEIALLRDVPRTATVTATTDLELYALERDVFVSAVSGHAQSARTADEMVASRLLATRPPIAPL